MATPFWTFGASIYLLKHHCLIYRDESLRVQLQIMTKTQGFSRGKVREYYFIDGVKKVFRNEESMLKALEHRERRETGSRDRPLGFLKNLAVQRDIL